MDRLAHHALRGEVWDKAVIYCQQASARAEDRAAFREAVAAFEQALQALAHLPEDSDTRVRAIELRLALRTSLAPLGEYRQCLALLGEAETLARTLDDQARLVQVLAYMGQTRRLIGDYNGAMAAGGRPSHWRSNSATAPCRRKRPIAWGRHTMTSATSARRPRCHGGAWRGRTERLARVL